MSGIINTSTRRPRRAGAFIIIVVLLFLIAAAALTAVQVQNLVRHTDAVSADAEQFVAAVMDDPDSAQQHLDATLGEIDAAQEALQQIPLPQLGAVPPLSQNYQAVDTMLGEVESLLTEAGPTLIQVADLVDFNSGELRDSLSSIGALAKKAQDIGQTIVAAPDAINKLEQARDAIGRIDRFGLLPPVRQSVDDTYTTLDDAFAKVSPIESKVEDIKESFESFGPDSALRKAIELLT